MFHAPQVVISSQSLLGEGETKTFKEVQIKKNVMYRLRQTSRASVKA